MTLSRVYVLETTRKNLNLNLVLFVVFSLESKALYENGKQHSLFVVPFLVMSFRMNVEPEFK